MVTKKDMAVAILATLCLTSTLFMAVPIKSQDGTISSNEYDPWIDTNDDGIIDIFDIAKLALAFGAEGEPINKTALLLDLLARVEALEQQSPRRGYISISPAGWQPCKVQSADYSTEINWFKATSKVEESSPFYAQVQLPHGATIVNFTAILYFGSYYPLQVSLHRNNPSDITHSNMAYIFDTGLGWPKHVTLFDDTIDYAQVDNSRYSYLVEAYFANPLLSDDLAICSVIIEYTY